MACVKFKLLLLSLGQLLWMNAKMATLESLSSILKFTVLLALEDFCGRKVEKKAMMMTHATLG